jgi:hypothetical protein
MKQRPAQPVRKAIKMRGHKVIEIMVEHREIPCAPVPAPAICHDEPCGEFQPLGRLAREIAAELRDKITFPARLWKVGQ